MADADNSSAGSTNLGGTASKKSLFGKPTSSNHVSQNFGRASDLLPPEYLKDTDEDTESYEIGDVIIRGSVDPDLLQQAVDTVKEQISKAGLAGSNAANADGTGTEREVVGIFVNDGRREYFYSDGSIGYKPDTDIGHSNASASKSTQAAEPTEAAQEIDINEDVLADALAAEVSFDYIQTPTLQSSQPPLTAPPPQPPHPPADRQEQLSPPPLTQHQPPPPATPADASTSQIPDLHITNARGIWLWDVLFEGDAVGEVRMADGACILKTNEPDRYVFVPADAAGARLREAQIITAVLCDSESGNIFYQSTTGDHAVALFNNGARLDQYSKPEGEDDFFITEPLKPGQSVRTRTQVIDLTLDQENRTVSYETLDGGMIITMRYRKIS